MWSVALFTATASLSANAAVHQHSSPVSQSGRVRLKLDNVYDMAFTTSLTVSGETVHPIIDTGSFDMVLFEHDCRGCSVDHMYFDRAKAGEDFRDIGIDTRQSYGSGTADASAVQAGMSFDSLRTSKQMFWLAYDVNLDMHLDDHIGGIFGLGPPASALAFAAADLKASEDWVKTLDFNTQEQYAELLASRRQVFNLSKKKKPWLENVGFSKFSICVLPGTRKSGVLVLNDDVPDSGSWVKVHGRFWQVDVAKASIGHVKSGACTAIVDSGTSLIGAPADFLYAVEALVDDHTAKYGCQDLSRWPSLRITLKDGQTLTLDPSSYVANFDIFSQLTEQDSISATAAIKRVKAFMPHLARARQRQLRTGAPGTVCAPAMFDMDVGLDDSSDCQFLFGLPIYREYYISHKIKEDGTSEAMHFGKHDADCNIMNQTELKAARKTVVPVTVDPKKIRFPSLGLSGKRAQLNFSRGRS